MNKQRERLLRALFLDESDHLNYLIRSGGLCSEDDEERACLVRNVEYAHTVFNFTTDNVVKDVDKSIDKKEKSTTNDDEKEITILRKNIYETWLANMGTLCHDYLKIVYPDNAISEEKSLQCELISYEGRSRLIHTLFYQRFRYREFP